MVGFAFVAGIGTVGEYCDNVSVGGEVLDEVSSGIMDGVATVSGNIVSCNGISDMSKKMVSQSHIGASQSRFSP